MTGKVTLVGAGPGDPGLLTRKGETALRAAEVVVYDRLIAPELLELLPPTAERIDVGKQADHHPVPQWRINEILLEKAQEGKNVVRLKGGDPFLFGRGGEELDLLAQHHIPFEVVPGVTSALAAPAFAGIPVTHRDYASSLHIVTGHAKAGSPLQINFQALAEAGGTCVFLMGVSALERICEGLLGAGMAENTPAAVVERGTLPGQRKVVSTLGQLAEETRKADIHSPAVIVVGEVAALSDRFDWFDTLPLKGRTIVVTRPKRRAGALRGRLRELGASVMDYPCIETVPRRENSALEQCLAQISRFDWVAFTSSAGVEVFCDTFWQLGMDGRALGGVKLAAVGPSTAQALEARHLRADYMPPVYDTEHLALGLAQRTKGPVLLPRAAMGSPILPRVLKEQGVAFTDVPVYDTVFPGENTEALLPLLAAGETWVTFTSASTVRGFVNSLPKGTDLSRVLGLCIGPQTAAECARHGIHTRVAREATVPALVELILDASQGMKRNHIG
ncbi:MAG: uroporphyrinogen-III C-methyltransferase [Clostridiales bacterium]|nr:uroporphyrinogen-III C-methyltransferase [Clostridiales bacterium]